MMLWDRLRRGACWGHNENYETGRMKSWGNVYCQENGHTKDPAALDSWPGDLQSRPLRGVQLLAKDWPLVKTSVKTKKQKNMSSAASSSWSHGNKKPCVRATVLSHQNDDRTPAKVKYCTSPWKWQEALWLWVPIIISGVGQALG